MPHVELVEGHDGLEVFAKGIEVPRLVHRCDVVDEELQQFVGERFLAPAIGVHGLRLQHLEIGAQGIEGCIRRNAAPLFGLDALTHVQHVVVEAPQLARRDIAEALRRRVGLGVHPVRVELAILEILDAFRVRQCLRYETTLAAATSTAPTRVPAITTEPTAALVSILEIRHV